MRLHLEHVLMNVIECLLKVRELRVVEGRPPREELVEDGGLDARLVATEVLLRVRVEALVVVLVESGLPLLEVVL